MPAAEEVRVVTFSGELTASAVDLALADAMLRGMAGALMLVDCRTMSGYSPEARDTFVDWFRRHRRSIARTAVVTENGLWHMVVRAMALGAGHEMKPFNSVPDAEEWLRA